jgi:hypothetical protein
MFSTTSFSSMHACISLRFLSLLGPAKLTLKLFVCAKTRGCIVKASGPICLYYPLVGFFFFFFGYLSIGFYNLLRKIIWNKIIMVVIVKPEDRRRE